MDSSRLNGNSFFLCNEAIYRLKTDHIFANLGADTPSEDKNYLTIPETRKCKLDVKDHENDIKCTTQVKFDLLELGILETTVFVDRLPQDGKHKYLLENKVIDRQLSSVKFY